MRSVWVKWTKWTKWKHPAALGILVLAGLAVLGILAAVAWPKAVPVGTSVKRRETPEGFKVMREADGDILDYATEWMAENGQAVLDHLADAARKWPNDYDVLRETDIQPLEAMVIALTYLRENDIVALEDIAAEYKVNFQLNTAREPMDGETRQSHHGRRFWMVDFMDPSFTAGEGFIMDCETGEVLEQYRSQG